MNEHTKGEWVARPDPSSITSEDWCIGVGDIVDKVAVCSKCDAHLIAASKVMLDALIVAQAYVPLSSPVHQQIGAAIAQAKGTT